MTTRWRGHHSVHISSLPTVHTSLLHDVNIRSAELGPTTLHTESRGSNEYALHSARLRARKRDWAHLGDELDGALAGEEVVVGDAANGDHGEAAVLDLLHLHRGRVKISSTSVSHPPKQLSARHLVVGERLRVLLQAERVEANVAGAVHGAVAELEKEGDLEEADEPEHLQAYKLS